MLRRYRPESQCKLRVDIRCIIFPFSPPSNLQYTADHCGDDNLCATEIVSSPNIPIGRGIPNRRAISEDSHVIKVMTAEVHFVVVATVITMDNRNDKGIPFGMPVISHVLSLYPLPNPMSFGHCAYRGSSSIFMKSPSAVSNVVIT